MKIVSGGQTGVDRAALDVALKHAIPCGGWCPADRLDEFGRIPDRYPVKELPNGGFDERTRQNVVDSDASIIFHPGKLQGGTEHTLRCCEGVGRPLLVIDAAAIPVNQAVHLVARFIQTHQPTRLNIAGPRQSEWPEGYQYVFDVLNAVLVNPADPIRLP